MEDRSSYPIPVPEEDDHAADRPSTSDGMLRSLRREPPASFLLKIDYFSSLSYSLSQLGLDSYVSGIFQVGGHKWRLSLYPDGDKKNGGDGYISLYLVLLHKHYNSHADWEVNVNFKLFVYDQIRNKYMSFQDLSRKVTRFHNAKTRHGFAKLLPLALLQDESNGYLRNDTCFFGAEVFVIRNRGTPYHCLSMLSIPTSIFSTTVSWSLSNFSTLNKERYYSDVLQSAEGRNWKFEIYPRGDKLNEGKLSVYLHLVDSENSLAAFGFNNFFSWFRRGKKQATTTSTFPSFPYNGGLYVDFVFQITDQLNGNHHLVHVTHSFGSNWTTSTPVKCSNLMPLTELTDPSKGFLANDKLIIECAHYVVCEVKNT